MHKIGISVRVEREKAIAENRTEWGVKVYYPSEVELEGLTAAEREALTSDRADSFWHRRALVDENGHADGSVRLEAGAVTWPAIRAALADVGRTLEQEREKARALRDAIVIDVLSRAPQSLFTSELQPIKTDDERVAAAIAAAEPWRQEQIQRRRAADDAAIAAVAAMPVAELAQQIAYDTGTSTLLRVRGHIVYAQTPAVVAALTATFADPRVLTEHCERALEWREMREVEARAADELAAQQARETLCAWVESQPGRFSAALVRAAHERRNVAGAVAATVAAELSEALGGIGEVHDYWLFDLRNRVPTDEAYAIRDAILAASPALQATMPPGTVLTVSDFGAADISPDMPRLWRAALLVTAEHEVVPDIKVCVLTEPADIENDDE